MFIVPIATTYAVRELLKILRCVLQDQESFIKEELVCISFIEHFKLGVKGM
jgi:hypothetical protein